MVEQNPRFTAREVFLVTESVDPILNKAFELLRSIPQKDLPHCFWGHTAAFLVLEGNEKEFLKISDFDTDPSLKTALIEALPGLCIFKEKHSELFREILSN